MGLEGGMFQIIKFRTMIPAAEKVSKSLPETPGDRRLTGCGRVLREYSLDELPQLWLVLTGKMSLVGPRPIELGKPALSRCSSWQKLRFLMRPGITGLAQVNGRDRLSWQEKFNLDAHYVERWSLWLDAMILLKTVYVVLARQDAYFRNTNDTN